MNRLIAPWLGLVLLTHPSAAAPAAPDVIPQPAMLEFKGGVFTIGPGTRILADTELRAGGELLAERFRQSAGFALAVSSNSRALPARGCVLLTSMQAPEGMGPEGYELSVTPDAAVVRAWGPAGAFYGVQTLLQLLPAQVYSTNIVTNMTWSAPCVEIRDHPRFSWRGVMLDVGRHYFPVADIKRMLDLMAMHKLNTFHWHLTDDQGWRIEIKQYPRLTERGAWRASTPPYGNRNADDGRRYGGFYTQAEVKEIVAYAMARHITVVPEIELPGHAAAAIAAYPEMGNSDIPGFAPRVMTRWGVHPYTFAPREETFRFLENVLTEVCDLFPSRFIHIGGDEAPKTQWKESPFAQEVIRREGLKDEHELQSWFVRRIERFLASQGRRLIGWDEIQEGGLPATATLMVWRDAKWANHALSLGNDVVMATTSHTYIDYYQAPAAAELAKGIEYEAIGGNVPLQKIYGFEPAFVAETPAQERQILGTQAQLWTEYMKDWPKVEYMAFPRLSALAEVAWSPRDARDYGSFLRRMQAHCKRLDQLGVNYYRPGARESSF